MEELRVGQKDEMTEYILTLDDGTQIRLFLGVDDWKKECLFMANVASYCDVDGITNYGVKVVKVD